MSGDDQQLDFGDLAAATIDSCGYLNPFRFDLPERPAIGLERGLLPCELLPSHDRLVNKPGLNFNPTANPANRFGGSERRARTQEWFPHDVSTFCVVQDGPSH